MKEQRFSFRHYKLIFLFFIFAALSYVLYWYLVPNLNYEIPVYLFVVIFMAAVCWYVYDAHFKTASISYIDTYPDCFVVKNMRYINTLYYYRDIHHGILTNTAISGHRFYRLDLKMKTGETVHLHLDNFSGKDIQQLAAVITAKTGHMQETINQTQ
jgi:hypothetical protein